MIYKSNLEELILNRHKNNSADELMILSGYTGPSPITKLSDLPIKASVIHGIKVQVSQKNILASYQNITETTGVDVFIKDKYNHSKIYCWLKNKEPIDILSGSANFSTAGLNSSLDGESLFDIEKNAYEKTYDYLKDASNDSIICTEYIAPDSPTKSSSQSKRNQYDSVLTSNPPKAEIFVGGSDGKMQPKSGWNWGHGDGHNNSNVAYQRISADLIKAIPQLFPNNGINISKGSGQGLKHKKPNAEILFDDGIVMDVQFQGYTASGDYYKQFSSQPSNEIYGEYVRKRLGLPSGSLITDTDINAWAKRRNGRNTITLELIADGVYFCDFS